MAASPQLTYAVAELFPAQGDWTEEEYLALDTNRIVELSDGNLEVAPMPNEFHQFILGRLFASLFLFVTQHHLGHVVIAPFRVRLWPRKFREPDLVFLSADHSDRRGEQFWAPPDLAVEIISPGRVKMDRVKKKGEYAQAAIPEYWILDPESQTVEVYLLLGNRYHLSQTLHVGETLTSSQFPGWSLGLTELFAPA